MRVDRAVHCRRRAVCWCCVAGACQRRRLCPRPAHRMHARRSPRPRAAANCPCYRNHRPQRRAAGWARARDRMRASHRVTHLEQGILGEPRSLEKLDSLAAPNLAVPVLVGNAEPLVEHLLLRHGAAVRQRLVRARLRGALAEREGKATRWVGPWPRQLARGMCVAMRTRAGPRTPVETGASQCKPNCVALSPAASRQPQSTSCSGARRQVARLSYEYRGRACPAGTIAWRHKPILAAMFLPAVAAR